MKSLVLLMIAGCCLCTSNVFAKKKGGKFHYPEVAELRASLLHVMAEAADSFRYINREGEPAIPGGREMPHIARDDKPDFFTEYKDGPLHYENDLQLFEKRDEDSKAAFFKWQQLIAQALPGHLRTVPALRGRLNESARLYYFPGTSQAGILLTLCQNGGDIRLTVAAATPDELKIVHAYNDGAPYDGRVLMTQRFMYDSSFRDNHYTGEVRYEFLQGGWYSGYYVDGRPEGEGELNLADKKEAYTGTFLNGKYHGKGKLTKGNVGYKGEFINGELVPGSFTTSDETMHYTITTPGMERYRNYASSVPAPTRSTICEQCKGTGLVSVMATCFSCHGTGASGTGYKTYDAHGYETGYKSLGCSYCHSTGLYTKYKRCGGCNGKGRP